MSESEDFRVVLSDAGIVYVDAGVLALHLAGDPRYLPLTRVILGGLRDREFAGLTSAITIYQLLVEPYRSGEERTAERVEMLVAALPGLEVVPVSATVARQAAQVKAQIGGGLPRAIQIATALAGESEVYVTRRSTLRRIAGLGVVQLDAFRQAEGDPQIPA
ncbi:MAG: type II toxin-antitoxin system VapC family toxin [Gemmatimonadetes bacterium]|nr:type II toxin-antitoxin system VapC family toxin [Gemmatimonadota bacterium]MBT8478392.1 type II toxin-antitoxin system VapC family toxin [Gemmatimonadota bacterium]NNK49609.1 type II toxin-antitoxin system VapC family toxin [Gemmatimonadota bacterium]